MPYNKKQKEYSMKYAKDNLKRIPLDVKKEYYDKVIVVEAEKRGISVRAFILQAIEEKISHDKNKN
jgi:predicted HicB family RNase H-like nuclease